jgi:predicted transcriptional regulator
MKLKDYLETTQERGYQFAMRAGIRLNLPYEIMEGKAINLKMETIEKIIDATKGAVRYEDLR